MHDNLCRLQKWTLIFHKYDFSTDYVPTTSFGQHTLSCVIAEPLYSDKDINIAALVAVEMEFDILKITNAYPGLVKAEKSILNDRSSSYAHKTIEEFETITTDCIRCVLNSHSNS